MSVKATTVALQTLHAAISGVTSAPTTYGGSINSADLPLVHTLPGEAEWSGTVGQVRKQARVYRVYCYVQPVSQGLTAKTLNTVKELLQAFGETYTDSDNLVLTTTDTGKTVSIQTAEGNISDTGLIVLEYGEHKYHGFRFDVRLWEKG